MTQQQIDDWNDTFPVGSPCMVKHSDGSEHLHHTRSGAWLIGNSHTVVMLEGKTGGIPLDKLKMLETHNVPI